jgi:hypothetical protein
VAELNQARAAARRARADWLLALDARVLGVDELVAAASADPQSPLRRIKLFQMIASLPGSTPSRARDMLAAFRPIAGVARSLPDRELTVGWLVDRRSNPRRITALVDALNAPDRRPPSERFPWSPIDDS